MKILVTGGAGFIGSHIVDALVAEGAEVVAIDDLSGGSERRLNPKARFHRIDLRQPELDSLFAAERPEAVCHQAARINIRESMSRPLLYADVNVLGSLNLLECCRNRGVGRIVYASTGGAVYGEPQALPVTENHPVRPLEPYAASKLCVEHYLEIYRTNFGVRFAGLRYGNVYGPRQDPFGEAGVVAIFATQMLNGAVPTIHGSGEQERDFVHVSDIVQANLRALAGRGDGVYNIGTGRGVSVNRIFRLLAERVGFPRRPIHGPAKAGEVFRIFLDSSKAERELGWRPRVGLEEGLGDTIEFFRSRANLSK